jgi:uridylate kinase
MAYKKILVKFSGESFSTPKKKFDSAKAKAIVDEVKQLKKNGTQVAIVCGGGNVSRWKDVKKGDRVAVDFKGIQGTLKNCSLLEQALKKAKVACQLYTSFSINSKYPNFDYPAVKKDWAKGKVIIFAGGTGYPFFTTDTSAVLFSLILGCEAFLKATKVDGVFSQDPFKFPKAKKFLKLSAEQYIKLNLGVVDRTAVSLARENNLAIRVFKWQPQNLVKLVKGRPIGSLIGN